MVCYVSQPTKNDDMLATDITCYHSMARGFDKEALRKIRSCEIGQVPK